MGKRHDVFGDHIDWNKHIGQVLEEETVFYSLDSNWSSILEDVKSNLKTGAARPSLVDCGCHIGRWSNLFQEGGFKYLGVDQSEAIIDKAKELNPKTNFEQSFLWDLPYEGVFDVAVCVAVLQHNTNEEKLKIVPKIFKALKPGGIFLFTESTVAHSTNTQLTYEAWLELMNISGFEFIKSWGKNDEGFDNFYLVQKPL